MQQLLALTFALLPQQQLTPPTPSAVEGERPWTLFDEVGLIVNEEVITYRGFRRELERERQRNPISTAKQEQALITRTLVDQSDRILSFQAGQDMGLPKEVIDRHVETRIESLIDTRGVVALSEQLQRQDVDSNRLRTELASGIYQRYWEEIVTGKAADSTGRIVRDRYVRPGFLKYSYDSNIQDQEFLRRLGGSGEEVVLRQLTVPLSGITAQEALAEAGELRDRVLITGDSFELMVEELNPGTPDRGRTAPLPRHRLKEILPGLEEFVAGAREGDISEPLPVERDGILQGFLLIELVERIEAIRPPFEDQGVQDTLSDMVRRNMDEIRLYEALNELYEGAYIWPDRVTKSRPAIAPRLGVR